MYTKTLWVERDGVNINKFTKSQETETSVLLENTPDEITTEGTPFSSDNMNHIENGIYQANEMITNEAADRIQGDLETLENSKEYTRQTVLAGNEQLAPVLTTDALLKTGLLNTRNYLCKVVADPVQSGVYQAIAGWTYEPEWLLYDDSVDFVVEQELKEAVNTHNSDIIAHENLRGQPNGIAALDENGIIIASQLPSEGGLHTVTHDDTLRGDGTLSNPLGVIPITAADNSVIISDNKIRINTSLDSNTNFPIGSYLLLRTNTKVGTNSSVTPRVILGVYRNATSVQGGNAVSGNWIALGDGLPCEGDDPSPPTTERIILARRIS